MKKYLMIAVAGLAIASCNKMDGTMSQSELDQSKYNQAFLKYLGAPIAPNQTWGFSSDAYTRAAFTRSQAAPAVAGANCPYDAAWVTTYLATAKEPDATNSTDNYDNTTYATNWDVVNYLTGDEWTLKDQLFNSGKSWEEQLAWMLANRPNWLTYNVDETYVTNFKITGTQNGSINVVGTEDADGDPRTVVVTGTWNLTAEQRVGGGGKIIVANGGKINLASGANLNSVNEAQIVVLPGGEISGDGQIAFSNGTNNDLLSGNWGTINVGKFNNNGGNFYNYGTLNTDVMDGGAANSCYYNHGKVNVGNSGSSANIRIYNGCQWNVTGNFRLKMLENCSYFHVGGRLSTIGSEDGTGQDAYVALGNNSLLDAQSLHNTGTNWYGPTGTLEQAYAVVDFGSIYQLDWAPGSNGGALQNGYFANNIYVNIHNQDNAILGSAGSQTAKQVFWSVVANGQGQGNGNVTEITDGDNEIIYGDEDFVLGSEGCKPSYTANVPGGPDPDYDIRIIAEDLSAQGASDFDFNDVVLDVKFGSKAEILLTHAGGTLPLCIGTIDLAHEVHNLFGVWKGEFPAENNATVEKQEMVNTGAGPSKAAVDITNLMNVAIADAAAANTNLPLYVYKNGTWQEMTAPKGEPACKLAVDTNYKVLAERKSIKGEYELFVEWATNDNFKSKWWE